MHDALDFPKDVSRAFRITADFDWRVRLASNSTLAASASGSLSVNVLMPLE